MADFFYQFMGETVGPVSAKELRRLALEGRIDRDTLIRTVRADRWVHAERVGRLFDPETDTERAEREETDARTSRKDERRGPVGQTRDQVTLADVLSHHLGTAVAINYRNPEAVETATLLSVSSDHFSIRSSETGLTYHFPLRMVLSAIEAEGGQVSVGGVFAKREYSLVLQVFHMVIYKGGIGVGLTF